MYHTDIWFILFLFACLLGLTMGAVAWMLIDIIGGI